MTGGARSGPARGVVLCLGALLAALLLPAGPADARDGAGSALAPAQALRPVARGQVLGGTVLPADLFVQRDIATETARAGLSAPRAGDRPETFGVARRVPDVPGATARSLRPRARPGTVRHQARAVAAARARGAVCGDVDLQGVAIGAVTSATAGCGIAQAVRVQSVSGVALSTHAVMDCRTAGALKTWVEEGLRPAIRRYGGGVARLRVVAHYACRPRNNRKGAKISEHGRGRAVDIAAIELRDGRSLTLLEDWGRGREGRMLRRAHDAACGPFGTVLGPEANALHRDHFHFDTARYRGGAYCR